MIFGVDRGQVGVVAARATASGTVPVAAAAAFVLRVLLVAASQKSRKQVLYVLVGSYTLCSHMSPSRENTGSDQVARLRFCTSWSRQLAAGDGVSHTRAFSRCYQLLPPWYHPYIALLLLLSPARCVGWFVVREKAYFVVDCCVAEAIVVEHCWKADNLAKTFPNFFLRLVAEIFRVTSLWRKND